MSITQSLNLVAASAQQADCANSASLSGTGDLTAGAWVKFNTLPVSFGDRQTIISKAASNNASTDWGIELVMLVGGIYVNMFVRNNAGTLSTQTDAGPFAFSTGVWYQITGTFNSAGTPACHIFVNGVQQTDTDVLSLVSVRANNGTPTHIGDRGVGVNLDGRISDVYQWDRVLSGTEITNLYSAPCSFAAGANLSAHWTLDGVYTDSSGNGNTLTPANSPTFVSDVPYNCSVTNSRFLMFM